jgi:uncharacterized membrane protein
MGVDAGSATGEDPTPVGATHEERYRVPLHPMLVTIPIGCWVAGLVFDIGSHTVADPGFLTRGATWLIAIGVITSVLAGLVGLVDAIPIPPGTAANRAVVIHLSLATATVLVAASNLVLRLGLADTRPVPVVDVLLSALTVLVLVAAGYYGGLVVHRYGVRVPGAPQPTVGAAQTSVGGDAVIGEGP